MNKGSMHITFVLLIYGDDVILLRNHKNTCDKNISINIIVTFFFKVISLLLLKLLCREIHNHDHEFPLFYTY